MPCHSRSKLDSLLLHQMGYHQAIRSLLLRLAFTP